MSYRGCARAATRRTFFRASQPVQFRRLVPDSALKLDWRYPRLTGAEIAAGGSTLKLLFHSGLDVLRASYVKIPLCVVFATWAGIPVVGASVATTAAAVCGALALTHLSYYIGERVIPYKWNACAIWDPAALQDPRWTAYAGPRSTSRRRLILDCAFVGPLLAVIDAAVLYGGFLFAVKALTTYLSVPFLGAAAMAFPFACLLAKPDITATVSLGSKKFPLKCRVCLSIYIASLLGICVAAQSAAPAAAGFAFSTIWEYYNAKVLLKPEEVFPSNLTIPPLEMQKADKAPGQPRTGATSGR